MTDLEKVLDAAIAHVSSAFAESIKHATWAAERAGVGLIIKQPVLEELEHNSLVAFTWSFQIDREHPGVVTVRR